MKFSLNPLKWFKQNQASASLVSYASPFTEDGIQLRKADEFHPIKIHEIDFSSPGEQADFCGMIYRDQFDGEIKPDRIAGRNNPDYLDQNLFNQASTIRLNSDICQFGLMDIDGTAYLVSKKTTEISRDFPEYHIRGIGKGPVENILSAYSASLAIGRVRRNMEKEHPATIAAAPVNAPGQ